MALTEQWIGIHDIASVAELDGSSGD
jgi:hypothetical protein